MNRSANPTVGPHAVQWRLLYHFLEPWSPGIIVISGFGSGVFQSANWTPWLLGETKLALWTAEQEPHLTRDGAPDLAKILVGDAHGSDVLWPVVT
jgi:hypothetical protein